MNPNPYDVELASVVMRLAKNLLHSERGRTGNLRTDVVCKGTWGSPTRCETHGDGVSIVLKRSGQCPVHGEGTQGNADGQYEDRIPGEPCALKGACTVRRGVIGNAPSIYSTW